MAIDFTSYLATPRVVEPTTASLQSSSSNRVSRKSTSVADGAAVAHAMRPGWTAATVGLAADVGRPEPPPPCDAAYRASAAIAAAETVSDPIASQQPPPMPSPGGGPSMAIGSGPPGDVELGHRPDGRTVRRPRQRTST
jgi:hypothetical protein